MVLPVGSVSGPGPSLPMPLAMDEMLEGAYEGARRRVRAICFGRRDKNGHTPADGWATDIEAACAERAVAKWKGVPWAPEDRLDHAGDVGPYHVRHTTLLRGGLLLQETDPPRGIFILVVGTAPELRIVGWLHAREGKVPRYWGAHLPSPCWLVPASELHPLHLLPTPALF